MIKQVNITYGPMLMTFTARGCPEVTSSMCGSLIHQMFMGRLCYALVQTAGNTFTYNYYVASTTCSVSLSGNIIAMSREAADAIFKYIGSKLFRGRYVSQSVLYNGVTTYHL